MTPFRAPLWARNPHAQTLLGALCDRASGEGLIRERITLSDGDFLDLDWLSPRAHTGPVLLVLHGLEGSSRSPYITRLLRRCRAAGWNAVVMHFRGCSGQPNRLARGYHAGETGDLQEIMNRLHSRYPQGVCAVGYSLGGSVLLKWLGEQGTHAPILAAAAVSVPFDLASAARRLDKGASRLYQWILLRWLKRSLVHKARARGTDPHFVRGLRTFRAFDGAVTAPLHGFRDANDYYRRASCRPYLRHITVPTLLVQAADDPFLMQGSAPDAAELGAAVRLELSARGGHVGFIGGGTPWAPHFWLDDRLAAFLGPYMHGGPRLDPKRPGTAGCGP
ncbi:hydrolase [Acidiferrobacter sp.]|uniref:hydrolase n=1 Tax=Acidiferrobacter sp. TaxID=1872107 RepID=UPI00261E2F8A|nr:hydrolase [Acidiferrobacter sp.]